VGQGLLLPSVVRWLGLASHAADEHEREHKAEFAARSDALKLAQSRLERLATDRHISPEVLTILRARHDYRAGRLPDLTSNAFDVALAAGDLKSELLSANTSTDYCKTAKSPKRRFTVN
jgi:CPA1 family monovalent cation:H+ antiporter